MALGVTALALTAAACGSTGKPGSATGSPVGGDTRRTWPRFLQQLYRFPTGS
jgi:hypothetical protein